MCYSSKTNFVILNIPAMLVRDRNRRCKDMGLDQKDSICIATLNIYQYDTLTNTLTKATRDSKTINESFIQVPDTKRARMFQWNENSVGYESAKLDMILYEFGKRNGNYISMKSGYGDAVCLSEYNWRYYYKTNILIAESYRNGCYDTKGKFRGLVANYLKNK